VRRTPTRATLTGTEVEENNYYMEGSNQLLITEDNNSCRRGNKWFLVFVNFKYVSEFVVEDDGHQIHEGGNIIPSVLCGEEEQKGIRIQLPSETIIKSICSEAKYQSHSHRVVFPNKMFSIPILSSYCNLSDTCSRIIRLRGYVGICRIRLLT